MKKLSKDFSIEMNIIPLVGVGVGLERHEEYKELLILLPFMGWSLKF